ncbi:MAG: Panacea domain-containing protein [Patescibacteria group bacterium]
MNININHKKYENVVLYLCRELNGEIRGKKKLAKLLYFADFDFYEKNQKSITGDIYRALPMGPFPITLDTMTNAMTKSKTIAIDQVEEREGYNPTEVYRCISKPNISVFDKDEMEMLDRIVVKYGHLNGKQLEELSHAEAPYIGTELKKEIPYELAFYRGTDFSDL